MKITFSHQISRKKKKHLLDVVLASCQYGEKSEECFQDLYGIQLSASNMQQIPFPSFN